MDFSAALNDLNQDVKKTTVVEVLLKEVKLGSLKNSFHAGKSPVFVSVHLHHFHKVLVSVQAVDVLWDKWDQIAQY